VCAAVIEACRAIGTKLLFVLGHTWFYPRFGFVPAAPFGFSFRRETGPAFMLMPLAGRAPRLPGGPVIYHPAFAEV